VVALSTQCLFAKTRFKLVHVNARWHLLNELLTSHAAHTANIEVEFLTALIDSDCSSDLSSDVNGASFASKIALKFRRDCEFEIRNAF
jgi:hypothetical protein